MLSRRERVPITSAGESTTQWVVVINDDWCKGCGFCYTFCPRQVLDKSKEFNAKGYYPPVVIAADRCVGCRLCEALCPDFAIYVKEEPKEPASEE